MVDSILSYEPCEDEDYYSILGCHETSNVSGCINHSMSYSPILIICIFCYCIYPCFYLGAVHFIHKSFHTWVQVIPTFSGSFVQININ